MRKLFLGVGAAGLISMAALVAAQTAQVKPVNAPAETSTDSATQPDAGTKMRLAAMDTSAAAFHKLDSDNDGRISALEAAENPRVAAAFTMADKDKDGYLSQEEFEAMHAASGSTAQDPGASSPSGDRATYPTGDRATYPDGDRATYPSGDRATYPNGDRDASTSGDRATDPSGDQPASGPNEPTPTSTSPSPRRIAHPK